MWHKILDSNHFISSLYKKVPSLNNVRIGQIDISNEGRRVSINFDMPSYPINPPKKWVNLGYNTVTVHLDLFDIKEITLKTENDTYRGNIELEEDNEGRIIVNITGTVDAKIVAGGGLIQSIKGYINKPL